MARFFYLRLDLFYLLLGIFTYGWSLLLSENWLALSYLRLKFGFFVFLLTVENRFSLYFWFPPFRN